MRWIMLTLKKVNREFENRGIDERLVKGHGYFYFEGGESEKWYTSSVMVNTLNQLTLDGWIKEWESLKYG